MGNMERSMKIPYKWCFNAENQGKWGIWQHVWFPAGYPQRIGRPMRWDIIQSLIGSMNWCASWWWWWWWWWWSWWWWLLLLFPLPSLEHLQYINTSLVWIGTGASISIQISCRWKSANLVASYPIPVILNSYVKIAGGYPDAPLLLVPPPTHQNSRFNPHWKWRYGHIGHISIFVAEKLHFII